MAVNEKSLTKGHKRKLIALRKSLGNKIADRAFSEWLKEQLAAKSGARKDRVAEKLKAALKPLETDKSINLGNFGYVVRRARGRGAKGFVVERIGTTLTPVPKKKAAASKSKRKTTARKAKKKASPKTVSN